MFLINVFQKMHLFIIENNIVFESFNVRRFKSHNLMFVVHHFVFAINIFPVIFQQVRLLYLDFVVQIISDQLLKLIILFLFLIKLMTSFGSKSYYYSSSCVARFTMPSTSVGYKSTSRFPLGPSSLIIVRLVGLSSR